MSFRNTSSVFLCLLLVLFVALVWWVPSSEENDFPGERKLASESVRAEEPRGLPSSSPEEEESVVERKETLSPHETGGEEDFARTAPVEDWGGAALPESGGRDIFEGEVLDLVSEPLDTLGHYRRTRLLRTDFHYPLVRVEERVYLDEENQQVEILNQEGVVADHVLVRREPGVSHEALLARAEAAGFPLQRKMRHEGLYRLTIPADDVEDLPDALAVLGDWKDALAYAEADPIVFLQDDPVEPDDPAYLDGLLWGLNNTGQSGGTADKDINAVDGWGIRTDTGNVVIGVVDSGVQFDHEDLADNMWVNPDSEAPSSQTHGYDAISGGVQAPFDQNRHGTHVAGTIGAVGDNDQGVVGVAWETQMMALKFVGSGSGGTISDAVDAIDFGIDNGATVLNNSWGGGGFSQTLFDAVERANQADVVFIAAAGNNADESAIYPAGYPLSNVVAVASYDRNGQRSNFSNFSESLVHIAAPGDGIYSTSIDPNDLSKKNIYENLSGTSMASPQVAGIVGLMRAQFPSEGSVQIINRLLSEAEPEIMSGQVIAGGADLGASLTGEPAGPMNDDFANARDLGSRSITTLGNLILASAEDDEPPHGGITANQSVWFTWQSPFDREIDVYLEFSEFDPVVAVYTGTELDDLTEVASATTDPEGVHDVALTFEGVEGQQYFIAVDTADGNEGSFRLTVESTPDNDRFENAEELTGAGGVFSTDNTGANKALGEGRHGGLFGGASLWYKYTPEMDGRLSVRNGNGSPVNLGISIYEGDTLTELVELDGVLSTTSVRERAFGFLEAGETYYIAVDTPNGAEYSYFIEWAFGSNSIAFTETDVTVADEGGPLEVTLERLSGLATPPESSVEWFTAAGNPGAVPGEDFLSGSGTLTWEENETGEKTVTLTISENESLRGEREFYVWLKNPSGGAYLLPGKDRLRVTIEDGTDPFADLPGKDTLFYFRNSTYHGYTVDEQIWMPVRRLGNVTEEESVSLIFADGTAEGGEDFADDVVVVEFAAGEIVRWVPLPLLPGGGPGDFTVSLDDPSRSAAAVSPEQGSVAVEILPVDPLYDPLRRLSDFPFSSGDTTVFQAEIEGIDTSDNGRFVVYATSEEMTGEWDEDDHLQVYLYDAVTEETTLLSQSIEGLAGNGDSLKPSISGDGRYVVFETVATNILKEDLNGPIRDIVLLDRLRGTREAVNVNSFGELAQIQYLNLDEPIYIESETARISKDGSAVAFISKAQNLEVNHPNEWWDDKLYVRDLEAGTTEIVSVGNDWYHPRGIAAHGSISRDGEVVAFRFNGPLTQEFTGLVNQVYVRDRSEFSTTAASRMPDGSLDLGSGSISSVVMSGDGSKVFFHSTKSGFAGESSNQAPSLYRHDRDADTTVLVDTGPDGSAADAGISNVSGVVAASEDGERVAFVSSARNFYPNSDGNTPNVFLKNLETGAIAPVTMQVDGSLTSGSAQWLAMDRAGDIVIMASNKTGLVDDEEEGWHVYGGATGKLTDEAFVSFATSALTVTRSASGGQTVEITVRRFVDLSETVSVSFATSDGTAVAGEDYTATSGTLTFDPGETVKTIPVALLEPEDLSVTTDFTVSLSEESGALRLVAPDTVEVTVEGVPEALSPLVISSRDGVSADRESRPVSISRDGGKVAFGSLAENLSSLDDSSRNKIFLRDVAAATLSLHAKEDATTPGDGASFRPVLSPEGEWVAFHSQAKNLVSPTIDDSRVHLFLENVSTGEIVLISQSSSGEPGDFNTDWWDESVAFTGGFQEVRVPGIGVSENADWVVFHSRATNLVSESTTSVRDIYLWERATGNLTRITTGEGGQSRQPVITPDGRYIAFISDKTDLVPEDNNTNGYADVFRYDRVTGEMIKVNGGMGGAEANGRSYSVAISSDGDRIAFDSLASNLVPEDTNETADVFVHTVSAGTTERVSVSSEGDEAISWEWSDNSALGDAGHSLQPTLSENGRFVSFHSNALGLVDGVSMPGFTHDGQTTYQPVHKLYVHDRQTGETASVIPIEPEANGFEAQISGDGQHIAFLSTDESMLDTETGTRRMVYRFPNPLAETDELTGFAGWRADRFGSESDDDLLAGPKADANNDGIVNLLKYLWGQDPMERGDRRYGSEVIEEEGERYFTLNLWVDPTVEDVTWGIAVSEDLEDWETLEGSEYTETLLGSDGGLDEWQLRPNDPINDAPRRFYRLLLMLEEQ
ncbi:MAG: S8 family serine peptidase [Opitutales bacterium]|nr:S8 family serine peptidase [Opitutales bacterium]